MFVEVFLELFIGKVDVELLKPVHLHQCVVQHSLHYTPPVRGTALTTLHSTTAPDTPFPLTHHSLISTHLKVLKPKYVQDAHCGKLLPSGDAGIDPFQDPFERARVQGHRKGVP